MAALHSSAATTGPPPAASTYQPPVVAAAAVPAAEVHTFSAPAAPRRTVAPKTQPAHSAKPKPKPRPATVRRTAAVATSPSSFRQALDAAVARIPTYRPGSAQWVVSRAYAFWGTADWYHDVLYVSPDVPRSKLYDVAVHEWSHELSVLDYAGDVAAATAAMNAWFGGSGLTGPERAADCMAILQGARWTHYTTCTNPQWRLGAAKLVAGQRL
ncbi:MAG: hypothetical protein JO079_08775 [Frankiaceae bacterium]|nr:hypothetical protein [Frankiaceae bacterium]